MGFGAGIGALIGLITAGLKTASDLGNRFGTGKVKNATNRVLNLKDKAKESVQKAMEVAAFTKDQGLAVKTALVDPVIMKGLNIIASAKNAIRGKLQELYL